jgi:hypothetical protein
MAMPHYCRRSRRTDQYKNVAAKIHTKTGLHIFLDKKKAASEEAAVP